MRRPYTMILFYILSSVSDACDIVGASGLSDMLPINQNICLHIHSACVEGGEGEADSGTNYYTKIYRLHIFKILQIGFSLNLPLIAQVSSKCLA